MDIGWGALMCLAARYRLIIIDQIPAPLGHCMVLYALHARPHRCRQFVLAVATSTCVVARMTWRLIWQWLKAWRLGLQGRGKADEPILSCWATGNWTMQHGMLTWDMEAPDQLNCIVVGTRRHWSHWSHWTSPALSTQTQADWSWKPAREPSGAVHWHPEAPHQRWTQH